MELSFLESLSNADSVAGSESEVRNLMNSKLNSFCDEVFCDNLGSIIFKKQGLSLGPKIMFAAHMDEVGFKVKNIADGGQLIVKTIGKVKPFAKFMQTVRVSTFNGKKIKGFLHSTYTEDQSNENIPGTTYVDVGASSSKEVEKLGIEIGNIVCFDTKFDKIDNSKICGKAFDDRIGCYIIASVLEKLLKKKHPNTIYFTATSSEEVGCRGAQTASSLIKPDIAFIIDASCYKDEFDTGYLNTRQIGKGITLIHSDRCMEANQELLNLFKNTAKKLNKNLQLDMFETGSTDGAKIMLQGAGVPTQVCCVPLRYGHCSASIANINDIYDAIEIFSDILLSLDDKFVDKCKSFI